VTCTSLILDSNHIEIRLTVNDVVVDRVVFSDAETAARFTIEAMHDHAGD
jgi:hypothetical protein